jgi:hypothetical protein
LLHARSPPVLPHLRSPCYYSLDWSPCSSAAHHRLLLLLLLLLLPLRRAWEDTTSCVHTDRAKFTSMGYSVRDPNFRYTIWLPWDGDKLVGDFSAKQNYGVELYTHKGDDGTNFDTFENVNVASDPQYADDVKRLHAMAVAHWSK